MRLLFVVLLALVALIQYPLWMGRGGWFEVRELQAQLAGQKNINEGLIQRNQALAAEVKDLQYVSEESEERARVELSMMRKEEVFVQILPPNVQPPDTNNLAVPAKPKR